MSNTSNNWKSQGGINRRSTNNILSNSKQSISNLTIPQQFGISNTTVQQYGDKRDMDNSSLYKLVQGEQNYDNIIAYYPFNNLNTNANTNTNIQLPTNITIKNQSLNTRLANRRNNFDLSLNGANNSNTQQTNPYFVYVPDYSQNAIQFRNNSKVLISANSLNTINTLGQTENNTVLSTIMTFETYVYIPSGTAYFCIFALDDIYQHGLYLDSTDNSYSTDCFYLWYKGDTFGNQTQMYYKYNNNNNTIDISNNISHNTCGELSPDKWHKLMVVFGGSYIAIYIDGKQTNMCLTPGGSYIPDKPIAFNLGTLYSNVNNSYIDIGNNHNTNTQTDNNGPMLLDTKISLKANTKEFIEYLANPGNGHKYATSRIPNSNQDSLIYLLSNEFIGFNANLTCESDVIVNGELTTYGETSVYAQSNFYDTAHFHGNVIFDSSASIVYDSSYASHINIFSSPAYVNYNNNTNASLLIQNAGGLAENKQMPSMLVYNSNNPIQDITNTDNLIFSISGDCVSIGPTYGDNSFNVLGSSLFNGDANVVGNLNITGNTTHGGGNFTHNGTMYINNLVVSGQTSMTGKVDISNNVSIDGSLNITNDANINGLTVGVGGGNILSNCVVGQSALSQNMFGSYNSAFGYAAGESNINGDYNTYIGYGADNSGNNNYIHSTAIGYDAKITSSDQIVLGRGTNAPTVYIPGNVGIGTDNSGSVYALDVSGSLNVSNDANINGLTVGVGGGDISSNCVVGQAALSQNTAGSYNSAFGYLAGSTNTTGVNNTYLGYNSTANASNYNNSTALGYLATITHSDQIVLGQTTNAPTVYIPGKVGVGIDNQNSVYAVDIHGGVRMDGSLNVTSGGATINGVTTFNSSVYGVTTNEYDDGDLVGNKFATLNWVNWFLQNGGGLWRLSNENNTHMYNSDFRNVGIGTMNPNYTLDVSGGANISNQLDVSGGATISGGTTINDGLTVNNELTVYNGANIYGSMTVENAITLTGSMTVSDGIGIDNGLSIYSGGATIDGSVNIIGYTEISGNTVIDGFAGVKKMSVGTTLIDPSYVLLVSGDMAVIGDIIHTGIVKHSGTINMTGSINIDGNTIHNGDHTHTGGIMNINILDVSGNGTIGGQLNVTSGCTIGGRLDVSGGVTIYGTSVFNNSVTGTTSSNMTGTGTEFATLEWVNNYISNQGIGGWTETEDVSGNYNIHNVNNGNVGIGTGTDIPQGKLDVRGGLYVSSDANINGLTVGLGGGDLSSNSVVGQSALFSNTTGLYNSAFGQSALYSNTTGSNNSAFGQEALYSNTTTGSNNSAFGQQTLYSNTSGSNNSAFGQSALYSNTTGNNNIAIGYNSGETNQTGSNNTYIGNGADCTNISYSNSTAVGYLARITKSDQIVFGQISNGDVVAPSVYIPGNVGIGTDTPQTKLDVSGGVYVRDNLDVSGIVATSNDAVIHGLTVGRGGANIETNSVVGETALSENTQGLGNTAIGYAVLDNNNIGNFNTAIGAYSGQNNQSGHYNTYLGYGTDCSNNNYVNSTAVGYNAMITSSNQIVLGKITDNSGNAPTVYIPGNVGIGTDNSGSVYALDVSGSVYVDGSLNIINGANIGGTTQFTGNVYGVKSVNNTGSEFATLDWVNGKVSNEGTGWLAGNITNYIVDIYNANLGGNVGIGTTDPTATLDVSGNFNVNSTQAFWTGVFTNSALNTSSYPSCAIAIGKIVSDNYHNYAGEVKFTISDNPNIDNMLSLGFTYNGDILKVKANRTVEIAGNLYINSSLYMNNGKDLFAMNNSGSYEQFLVPRDQNNNTYLTYGTGGFYIQSESQNSVTMFMNNGNVGIGNNNPTATLDVSGNFNVNSTQAFWTGVFTNSALDTDYPSCAIAVGKDLSDNCAGEVKFTNSANSTTDNMLSLGFTYNGDILKVKANRTVEIGGNLYINGNGNLYINGTLYMNNGNDLFAMNNSGSYEQFLVPRDQNNNTYLTYGTGGFYIQYESQNSVTMFMNNSGNVGIGKTNPATALDVNGTITATMFNATSDLRLKDNINDLSNSLEKICAIRGVEYTWKGDDTKKLQCGVIAQEVNMIIPEAVNTSNPDTMTVNYNAIIGHLIESIKTLKQEVDNLKSQLPRV